MQYIEIFSEEKKRRKFHRKSSGSFNIFAQNIDCGYTLEPRTHNLCFGAKLQNKLHVGIRLHTPGLRGFTFHRHVFLTSMWKTTQRGNLFIYYVGSY